MLDVEAGLERVVAAQVGEAVVHLHHVLREAEAGIGEAAIGPPNWATLVTLMAGPVPASPAGTRPCARVAYWTRSSFSRLVRIVETNCSAVECCRSAKSVARCTEPMPPPTLAVMKLSKKM